MSLVLLLPGIWNPACGMLALAWRLRRAGFEPSVFDYCGALAGAYTASDKLAHRLARLGDRPVARVGYRLGGLAALEALCHGTSARGEWLVCLGSPLLGREAARGLRQRHAGWLLGHSRTLWQEGVAPWRGRVPVGMIAGAMRAGAGEMGAELGESDGTVALA